MSVCKSLYLFQYVYIHLSNSVPIYLALFISIYPCSYLCSYLSIHLSICLSIYLSITILLAQSWTLQYRSFSIGSLRWSRLPGLCCKLQFFCRRASTDYSLWINLALINGRPFWIIPCISPHSVLSLCHVKNRIVPLVCRPV